VLKSNQRSIKISIIIIVVIMEQPIPSSAFLKIGQQMIVNKQIVNKQIVNKQIVNQQIVKKSIMTIRTPALATRDEITSYDILKEWANELMEHFGEYWSPFM
jgi:hypothetical protein